MSRVLYNPMNGRLTTFAPPQGCGAAGSYEDAKPQEGSYHWCVTEGSRTNARYVNFSSGNANSGNKYNSNTVRPVAAFSGHGVPEDFITSVWEAYHDCLKGKMRSAQALDYMQKATDDIPVLAAELQNGDYRPGTSTCFLVKYPKLREVFAAGFRDRIVHHWICLRLEPLFEQRFREQGNVSFNCRRGFGVEKAVIHVADEMRRVSGNYRRPAWVFRGDLVGFFMSIDKDRLWYLLERFIRRKYMGHHKGLLLHLVKVVVMHQPEKDCVLNTPKDLWQNLAPNKSLFTTSTGMPIGNLTTQLFANFYLSFFVSYVKFLFRRTNYALAQFVDDFVVVCDDLHFLTGSIGKMERFLWNTLRLRLHRDKRYLQPVSHGVRFVGTVIKPGRLYLSNRTLARLTERCEGFRRMLEDRPPTMLDLRRMEQVLNSYLGFCRRRHTYRFRRQLIDGLGGIFWKYFYVKGRYESVRVKTKYKLAI